MSDTFQIQRVLTFKLPGLPNYITDANSGATIDVADMTEAELNIVGKQWTLALLEHAERRRKQRKTIADMENRA